MKVALYSCAQKKEENIQDYVSSLLDLNQCIYRRNPQQELDDESLKAVFVNGVHSESLKQHLKTTVKTGPSLTIDDLRERATQFEKDQGLDVHKHKCKTVDNKSQQVNDSPVSARDDLVLKKLEKLEKEISDIKKKQSEDKIVANNKNLYSHQKIMLTKVNKFLQISLVSLPGDQLLEHHLLEVGDPRNDVLHAIVVGIFLGTVGTILGFQDHLEVSLCSIQVGLFEVLIVFKRSRCGHQNLFREVLSQ